MHCNAQLNAGQVRRICRMIPGAERLLRASYDALGLSARAHDRILRVARTVADLAGKSLMDEDSLLEALQYRAQEKVELCASFHLQKHRPLSPAALCCQRRRAGLFFRSAQRMRVSVRRMQLWTTRAGGRCVVQVSLRVSSW